MNYSEGQVIHGFSVTRVRKAEELSSVLYELEHINTGAKLIWLANSDENKLFSVTFKTLPENDTGVFHILEHSVLNGSERYPVHEPFVELLKSSMNTYLNAMTFPDKTMYPVSSRNRTDFMNLSSVYLDAVFCPTILRSPNAFYQEGIHIEPTGEGRGAVYKGVVFNEMKGATSGSDSIVEDRLQRELFPDTCYKWNSGGDPRFIPDLTYVKYLDTYRRFYHPSNAIFYLDGSVPFEELLELIDSRYLCNYSRSKAVHEIAVQEPVPSHTVTQYYELPRNEELEGKNIITFGKLLCRWYDRTTISAANIICDYLTSSNDSPLKRAMLDNDICEDISLYMIDGINQPAVVLDVQNTSETDPERIMAIVTDTVRQLLEEGIDKRAIEAYITASEFRAREASEPRALIRALNVMNSALYGGDPLMYIVHSETFAALRAMLEGDGFEKLIEKLLLDRDNTVSIITLPSYEYGEELRRAEAERVAAEAAAMSDEEFARLVELNKNLVQWQQTPDSPEALASIPTLELSEVSGVPAKVPTETSELGGAKIIYHKLPCNGIIYVNLLFNLSDMSVDELADLGFASSLFGELPTEHYSVLDLQTELKLCTGRHSISVTAVGNINNNTECKPMLNISFSVLPEKLHDAEKLVLEILRTSDFGQTEKIREAVIQEDFYGKRSIESSGNMAAMFRAWSGFSSSAVINDALIGIGSVRRLHRFAESFDEVLPVFMKSVEKLLPSLCRERLTVSVTADELPALDSLIESFPSGAAVPEFVSYALNNKSREAFTIASQISFAGFAASPFLSGKQHHGSGQVLSHILSLNYLWNSIRVQGGAYGASCSIDGSALMRGATFRDPSPVNSLAVIKDIPGYIRGFAAEGESLDKFIISTLSDAEPLAAPYRKGHEATIALLCGSSYERKCRTFAEILATSHDDLLDWADYIEKAMDNAAFCVIGFADALTDADGFAVEEL